MDPKQNVETIKDKEEPSVKLPGTSSSILFDKLNRTVEKSVKRVTSKMRVVPYFKEHFRNVYKNDSENFLKLSKSMLTELESMIKEEIEMQLETNNTEQLLSDLDKIKQTYSKSLEQKWRPSGNPSEDIKAHTQESAQLELQQLEKVLYTLESHNKMLNECVRQSDEKLLLDIKTIENSCSSWSEAASVVPEETREMLLKVNKQIF
ncbi:polyamine-modulated factor 1-like [Physella acuta]|uniref:polyamine-modulated factor 1-like n=1 Tax=Physella acuta TaxID=109671 RepID=UPI0027DC0138|nr:polyamine-modulated factor 1-like [Physella acuta]